MCLDDDAEWGVAADGSERQRESVRVKERAMGEEEATRDFYEVLGVSRSATDDEIRSAYKKGAIRWHPDKNRHQEDLAAEKFKELSTAYAVLR